MTRLSGSAVEDIKRRSTRSLFWSFLSNITTRVITPFSTIILAKLLTPEDYGIIGVAALIIALLDVMQTAGMTQALVQRQSDIDEAANCVFWSNLAFSLVLFGALWFLAPQAASWFADPRVIPVIKIMGFQLVIRAFGNVQSSLLMNELRFKKLFWASLMPSLIPFVVAAPMAYLGYGYWSLVYGTLAGSVASTLILWLQSPWRPKFHIEPTVAKAMLVFGLMAALEGIVGWMHNYFDNAIVGHYLGMKDLGLYSQGYRIVMMLMSFFVAPVTAVSYSSFSRLQSDREHLRDGFLNVTKAIALICVPVAFGLASAAKPITQAVFGPKWEGLEVIIAVIGIMPGLSYLWTLNSDAYRAVGRPDINAKFGIASLCYVVPVFFFAAQQGLNVFLAARFSVGIVFLPVHIYLAVKVLGLSWNYLWTCSKTPFWGAVAMIIVNQPLIHAISPFYGWGGLQKLILVIGLSAAVYGAVVYLLDRKTIFQIFNRIRASVDKTNKVADEAPAEG